MSFTEQDRKVFAFEDGSKDQEGNTYTVYADPLEIQGAMSAALGGDVDGVIARSRERDENGNMINPAEVAFVNTVKLVGAIRRAFDLKPLDRVSGRGCTASMCITIWNKFVEFQNQKKT